MTKQLKILMLGTTEGPDDKAAKSPDVGTAEGSDDEAAVRITEDATR